MQGRPAPALSGGKPGARSGPRVSPEGGNGRGGTSGGRCQVGKRRYQVALAWRQRVACGGWGKREPPI